MSLSMCFEESALHLVYANSGRILETAGETGNFFADQHYETALQHMDAVLEVNDTRSVIFLLLMALYCLRGPKDPAAWILAGLAVRLCIELARPPAVANNNIGVKRFRTNTMIEKIPRMSHTMVWMSSLKADYSPLSLQSVFVAGLTLMYCTWLAPRNFLDVSCPISDCNIMLYVMTERWPAARKALDQALPGGARTDYSGTNLSQERGNNTRKSMGMWPGAMMGHGTQMSNFWDSAFMGGLDDFEGLTTDWDLATWEGVRTFNY
ncbi:uncharacterized protein PAC_14469 [Phialocephala subalpina]|uniref:Transcription factor domain-containing protein n=1 Tax=Phialocephala subalpina TaxID=576137 RepID=A0A1L7XHS0_9HELO|nr:uncharacterized protein PAC_14469 [Phialocephala subalpina]